MAGCPALLPPLKPARTTARSRLPSSSMFLLPRVLLGRKSLKNYTLRPSGGYIRCDNAPLRVSPYAALDIFRRITKRTAIKNSEGAGEGANNVLSILRQGNSRGFSILPWLRKGDSCCRPAPRSPKGPADSPKGLSSGVHHLRWPHPARRCRGLL